MAVFERVEHGSLGLDGAREHLVDAGATVVREYDTRAGTIWRYRVDDPGESDLAIKIDKSWDEHGAFGLFSTLKSVEAASRAIGTAPIAPAAFTYGDDPQYVCIEWIDGEEMREWMHRRLE